VVFAEGGEYVEAWVALDTVTDVVLWAGRLGKRHEAGESKCGPDA
jgi:hypothetical protein